MQLIRTSLLLAILGVAPASASAQPLSCPSLADAQQVGTCPSDAELRYTFVGYCSDNARMYDRKSDDCTDFARYRRSKNIALWESADGEFSAYASCDLPPETIRAARPTRVTVERSGRMTHLVCSYGDGLRFVHRTRATCRVDGDGDCATPEQCRAACR